MGWFSKSPSNDTKARIEELKKKIQAEQVAYAQSTAPAAPAVSAAPAAPVAPPPPAEPAPAPVIVAATPAPVTPAYAEAPRERPAHHQRHDRGERQAPVLDRTFADMHEQSRPREQLRTHQNNHHNGHEGPTDAHQGIVLDLGEGMSLNLPIRSRMQLDEFLLVAQRVRELQRLQRGY